MYKTHSRAGFTLIEMLVVVGIIALILSVLISTFAQARASSRDKDRVADIALIELALEAYIEQTGYGINCTTGMKIDGSETFNESTDTLSLDTQGCNDADEILAFIAGFLGQVPADPLGPDNNDYFYYFDAAHLCLESGSASLLYAVNLETSETNAVTVCGDHEGNDGGYQNTSVYGGGITHSQPYVVKLDFGGPLQMSTDYDSPDNTITDWWDDEANQTRFTNFEDD